MIPKAMELPAASARSEGASSASSGSPGIIVRAAFFADENAGNAAAIAHAHHDYGGNGSRTHSGMDAGIDADDSAAHSGTGSNRHAGWSWSEHGQRLDIAPAAAAGTSGGAGGSGAARGSARASASLSIDHDAEELEEASQLAATLRHEHEAQQRWLQTFRLPREGEEGTAITARDVSNRSSQEQGLQEPAAVTQYAALSRSLLRDVEEEVSAALAARHAAHARVAAPVLVQAHPGDSPGRASPRAMTELAAASADAAASTAQAGSAAHFARRGRARNVSVARPARRGGSAGRGRSRSSQTASSRQPSMQPDPPSGSKSRAESPSSSSATHFMLPQPPRPRIDALLTAAARSYQGGFVRAEGAAEAIASRVHDAVHGTASTGLLTVCVLQGQGLLGLLPAAHVAGVAGRRLFVRACLVQPPESTHESKPERASRRKSNGATAVGPATKPSFQTPPPQINPLLCRRLPLHRTATIDVADGNPVWNATAAAELPSPSSSSATPADSGQRAHAADMCVRVLGNDQESRQRVAPPGGGGALDSLDWRVIGGYILIQLFEERNGATAAATSTSILLGQGLLRVCDFFAGCCRRFDAENSNTFRDVYGVSGAAGGAEVAADEASAAPLEFYLQLSLPLAPAESTAAAERALGATDWPLAPAPQIAVSFEFPRNGYDSPPAVFIAASIVLPVGMELEDALVVQGTAPPSPAMPHHASPLHEMRTRDATRDAAHDDAWGLAMDQANPVHYADRVDEEPPAPPAHNRLKDGAAAAAPSNSRMPRRDAVQPRSYSPVLPVRLPSLPAAVLNLPLPHLRAVADREHAQTVALTAEVHRLRAAILRERAEVSRGRHIARQLAEMQPSPLDGLARSVMASVVGSSKNRSAARAPGATAQDHFSRVALTKRVSESFTRLRMIVADAAAVLGDPDTGAPPPAIEAAALAQEVKELSERRAALRGRLLALEARQQRDAALDEQLLADLRERLAAARAVA